MLQFVYDNASQYGICHERTTWSQDLKTVRRGKLCTTTSTIAVSWPFLGGLEASSPAASGLNWTYLWRWTPR